MLIESLSRLNFYFTFSDNEPLQPSLNIVYFANISIPALKLSLNIPFFDIPISPVRIPITLSLSLLYNISFPDIPGNISTPISSAYYPSHSHN